MALYGIIITAYLVLGLLHALVRTIETNPPIVHYSHNMRILKIPVNTEPGSIVYRIKASDADNEDVTFDILEDYGKSVLRFDKINHLEANVVLISSLKENDQFNLTIYATDQQESTYIESRLIATSVPNVTIYEDTSPILLQQNPVYVFENETLNKSIVEVRAFEREDSKLPVTFELLEESDEFDFHYVFGPRGTSTAHLVLINSLDYERRNLYILTILAINARTNDEIDTRNVHSVKLSIVIKDVQDSPPIFHNLPQSIIISEPFVENFPIYNVSASDGDTVNHHNVTFLLIGSSNGQREQFKMHTNGSVFLTASYAELTAIYAQTRPIVLEIQANEVIIDDNDNENENDNQSISSTSQLFVLLEYGNRAPQFNTTQLLGNIREHSTFGSAVLWQSNELAHLVDLDEGLNGTVELELYDSDGTFTVQPMTAYRKTFITLTVNDSTKLDYEQRTNLSVMIIAKDKSKETPMMSNVTCTIMIDDINDHPPEFTERLYEGAIFENAQEGTSIAQIIAKDRDTGNFGKVYFTAIRGIHSSISALDREMFAELFLTIEARDNLGYGYLNTTELYIRVLDMNDNAPIFLQSHYTALIDCETNKFILPIQVTALDLDEANHNNSVVNYEILHGNYEDVFELDINTGSLRMKRSLPNRLHSSENRFTLTVRAYDLGVPQMWSNIKNRPNMVRASFVTRKKLQSLPGNDSLQKYLSDITGGNVTITELKSGQSNTEPSSIVTSVQYNNESTIDLDSIPIVFDHLVEKPKEREVEESVSHKYESGTSTANQESVTIRQIRTSQWGNLDILLWIMVLLIFLLMIVLIYLLCIICKDRKKGKTIIVQNEAKPSPVPYVLPSRLKKRKLRKVRNVNKVDLSTKRETRPMKLERNDVTLLNNDTIRPYELEEKRYETTPSMFTYYEFKRMRYPSNPAGPSTVNVLSLHRNENAIPGTIEPDRWLNHFDNSDESNRIEAQEQDTPIEELVEQQNVVDTEKPLDERELKENQTEQMPETENNREASQLVPYEFEDRSIVPKRRYRGNMQKKSIFTITYDKINSRENISAGSESGNTNALYKHVTSGIDETSHS
ncbi:hypothetical protein RDWZM_007972 [Blomia tropicalis]|uniref:Cadherin domain-containing protein n=1 Tax=Blomia tropicalis TaxID=40697 RepID=A0A9Q0M3M7_BLOTA|nr:hypothetical protein RDWZM_007972 [Blomia tropicalis]